MKEYNIVQFLHTGKEPSINENSKSLAWNNNANHARKFIKSNGIYIGKKGEVVENTDLTFWGEWEAQSEFDSLKNDKQYYPKHLHKPYIDPSEPHRVHNTDPYIFGSCFRYIICMQPTFHKTLSNLKENSIILFGSSINKEFCLDTVFVVSKTMQKYTFANANETFGENKGQYYHASVLPLCGTLRGEIADEVKSCGAGSTEKEYTYYEGVTHENKNEYKNIYSFSPCKNYNQEKESSYVFKQPKIDLDVINHNKSQGVKSTACSLDEITHYWNEISLQIENQNLLKGVHFNSPKLVK